MDIDKDLEFETSRNVTVAPTCMSQRGRCQH